MTAQGLLQVALYVGVLVLLAKPLGSFMAAVYEGRRTFLPPVTGTGLGYRLALQTVFASAQPELLAS